MEQESPHLDCIEDGDTTTVTNVVIETTEEEPNVVVDVEYDSTSVSPLTITVEGDKVEEGASVKTALNLQNASNPLKRKSGRNFMVKATVLSLLLKTQSFMKRVPIGPKAGQYFLLQDDRNFFKGRRRLAKNTFQVDEYDNWQNLSLKKHYYLYLQGRFKYVDYIGGQYQLYQSMAGEKSKRCVMEKQPSPDEILVVRKLHSVIPGHIRRRISYIEKLPQGVEPKQWNLILVEYHATVGPITKTIKFDDVQDELSGVGDDTNDIHEFGDDNEEIEVEFHDYPTMLTLQPEILEEVAEPVPKKGGANSGVFFDKNEVIEILLTGESALEEIPFGPKEDEYFIVKNEDNYQRESEGKRRLYIDDCGVWKNVSMKKHLYTKIDNGYFYVEYSEGKYQVSNTQIRGKYRSIGERDVLELRKVYGCLKRCEAYKRRICWIDKFPHGVTPRQRHICLVEYVGKYPKEVPHGNQKKPNAAPYVRTPSLIMKKMKEEVAHKTVKEVLADFPTIETSPRQVKQLHNLRYRSTMRICPGSAKSEALKGEMGELYNLVQSHPFVQQLTLTKYKSPVVIAYTAQQVNSWKFHCQERSGLDRLLGVDRSFNIGPVCLTILTYPHPNLLCRQTQRQAIMMGPILFHVDKSWTTFSLLFDHLSGCLSAVDSAQIDGISVACKTEEEQSIKEALKHSFPKSRITLCAEHMKMDLKDFLSKLRIHESNANRIVKEVFGELMTCTEEYDFDIKVANLQTEYEVWLSTPEFRNYFKRLCENVRRSVWRPTMERSPLLQWSPTTCHALTDLIEFCKNWGQISLPRLVSNLYDIVSLQEQEEIRSIHDEGRYILAPHAQKYAVSKADWQQKTSKQKARLAESMRKIKPGTMKTVTNRMKGKQNLGCWQVDPPYF